MINRKFILSALIFLTFNSAIAQSGTYSAEVDLLEKTPTSPNTGSLGRYFEFPVNMATGIPNIEIPLYMVKTGNITVPITLKYHGGGIKVNDIAGWVGLGWSLDASGSIIKKVNGLDDYYAVTGVGSGSPNQDYMHPNYSIIPYHCNFTNMIDAIDSFIHIGNPTNGRIDSLCRFFTRVVKGNLDAEADEFIYCAPGMFGKFFYNQKQQLFQTNKNNGTKVSVLNDSLWLLKASNGLQYRFERIEHTVNPAYQKGLSAQQILNTAWHLTSVSDLNTGAGVNFTYDNYPLYNVHMGVTARNDFNFTHSPYEYFQGDGVDINRSGDNYVLATLSYDQGTIYFVKDTSTRMDDAPHSLKEIRVYNNRNVLLKKFLFTYFYTSCDSIRGDWNGPNSLGARLYLNSVQEINYDEKGRSQIIPPYKCSYDTSIHLPSRLSFAQDKWGYYNGKHTNTTSIPSHPAYQTHPILTAADRNIDTLYSKAGMLTGLVYPTGGKALFEFENNRTGSGLVGGMRIKKITNYDSVAPISLITEYRYVDSNGYATGEITSNPVFHYDLYHLQGDIWPNELTALYLIRTEGDPISPLFPNQGSAVFYSVVEKREKSSKGDLLSRHFFTKYFEAWESVDNSIGVPHPKTAEVSQIVEKQTELYERKPSGSYRLAQIDYSEFNTISAPQNYIWNAQASWDFYGSGFVEYPEGDPETLTPMQFWIWPSLHAYKIYPSQPIKNSQFTTLVTDQGTSFSVGSFYQYDASNGNVKIVKSVSSAEDTTIRIVKYACDFSHTGAGSGNNYQIDLLLDNNILSAPIEILTLLKKKDSSNSVLQGALLYEYDGLKVKKIYKVYDQIPYNSFTVAYNDANGFYKDSHYKLQQEVTAWDGEGRPKTVITNTNKTAYTWDERFRLPTSIVSNASSDDVAYTSFEGQSNGSWTVNSSNRDSSYFITGRRCYQLSNGNVSRSGLTSGTIYIVSYWSRNGSSSSYSVSGSSSVKEGKTVNGWTYYEHSVTGVTTVTVSGSNYIDELRIYPKAGEMVSFCYEELLGVTTQCDVANHINYYEYYGPEKLRLVRDQDKNIVKKICYNYAGQAEDCIIYSNVDTSANFRRANCGTGYVGSVVSYSIPAGTYFSTISQSEANQLALNDITANGQANANSTGTCTSCSGSFSVGSGWLNYYQSITPNSTTISLTLVIGAQSSSSFNNISSPGVIIGTINSCCRPLADRSFSCYESGRLWSITVYTNGQIRLLRTGGAALPNPGVGFTISGSYSL